MDKDTKDLGLFKIRSVGASVRDGYRLYMDNFRKIFRTTWLVAVVYALYKGLFSTVWAQLFPAIKLGNANMLWGNEQADPQLLLFGSLLTALILAVVFDALLAAFGLSLLRQHKETGTMASATRWFGHCDMPTLRRTLLAALAFLAFTIGYGALTIAIVKLLGSYLTAISILGLTALTVIVLFLLAPLVLMRLLRYVLSSEQKPSLLKQNFPLRHWGGAILLTLIVGIVSGLLIMVTELPANILTVANVQSVMGALAGDATGMPDYMLWLNIIVFTLAGFIRAYISLSVLFPFYYLCGSVEQQEKERNEVVKNL
jgi:hypothetical protein